MPGSPYRIAFEGSFAFPIPPERLWAALERTEDYPRWWRWMRDIEVTGDWPEEGSTLTFNVAAPIPYRLRLTVTVEEEASPRSVKAQVEGSLTGEGGLDLEPTSEGTNAQVGWDVEVTSRALRPMIGIARPILVRAQHWAVTVALRGFRRHLERA